MQVSTSEADRLHWQERYQESLKKGLPASLAHSLPISRAASHRISETSPDKALSIVVAADEDAEPLDDLDKLIRCTSFNDFSRLSDPAQYPCLRSDWAISHRPLDCKVIAACLQQAVTCHCHVCCCLHAPMQVAEEALPVRRAASGAPQHLSVNGHAAESAQLQHLQRRLSAAEADAEGARMELLRACQQAEAAAADVARCGSLEQSLQVSEPALRSSICTQAFRRLALYPPHSFH